MPRVIAWPPVPLTGWELTRHHPVSRSGNLFGGPDRTSGVARPRYLATAVVPGISADRASAGYMEMLKDQIAGGAHLVRVPSMAPLWHLHSMGRPDLAKQVLTWSAGGGELLWTSGRADLSWTVDLETWGDPEQDGQWPALRVTGLPPGVAIRPSEWVRVRAEDGATEVRRVLTATCTDAAGAALIRLDAPMTRAGVVGIGLRNALVFQVTEIPRVVQGVGAHEAFRWSLREVFEEEVTEGFTEVDPWH